MMPLNVSYASHLAGVRRSVVHLNEYQTGPAGHLLFFLAKHWTLASLRHPPVLPNIVRLSHRICYELDKLRLVNFT